MIFTNAVNGLCFFFFFQKNIFVADLTEEMVTTPAQALAWISKGESKVPFIFLFFFK